MDIVKRIKIQRKFGHAVIMEDIAPSIRDPWTDNESKGANETTCLHLWCATTVTSVEGKKDRPTIVAAMKK